MVGVYDAVAVSVEQTAIIGTATADLADIGFAYYEIMDDFGVLDYGYLTVLQDGSYRAYLTADLQQAIVGDPLLYLYHPLDFGLLGPVQVNFMMGGDSVSAIFTRIMATGDAAQIRAFLQLMRETGQLSAQQLAQLEARLATVEAAEATAAAAAAAAEHALLNWARSRGLNAASEFTRLLYANRAKTVQEFISMARKGGVKEVLPESVKRMPLEEALKKGIVDRVNIRKILIDNRDKFAK